MSRCYLFPTPGSKRRPSFLHPTDGLPGNWALDFMAPGGSPILSPVDAKVVRWSGHAPSAGEVEPGIFGWTMYLQDDAGAEYFLTHIGRRLATVGTSVCRGQRIAVVGNWPNDPGRSHLHLGVTYRNDETSKALVKAIAAAIRLQPM